MMNTGRRKLLFIASLLAMLCLGTASPSNADDALAAQRALFVQTRAQLQHGQDTAARKGMAKLKHYPLYPYLQADQLSAAFTDDHHTTRSAPRVRHFLKHHDGTVVAGELRDQWLDALAAGKHWRQYLRYYRAASAGKQQQCWHIEALYRTGQHRAALDATDKLWLTTDMPATCDAAFKRWLASDHRREKLVWQRLQLALKRDREPLARSLTENIRAPYKLQAEYALILLHDPSALAELLPRITQQPDASATIALALENLARSDLDSAQTLWLQTRAAGQLSARDSDRVRRAIGRQQVAQNGVDALPWLVRYDADGSDSYLLQWRIRLALGSDWRGVARWIEQLPPRLAHSSRWMYWRARALAMQHGDPHKQKQADAIFAKLAKERSYYGFLAADRQKTAYHLNDERVHSPVKPATIARQPAIVRAHEFFLIGDQPDARREWHSAVDKMSTDEKRAAALLAERWGWYDRSIFGALHSDSYDDLHLRFPIAFHDRMQHAAKKTDLPVQWLYAIARQESAFMPDARSPVGALGIMQLMPATARHVARSEHLRINTYQLLQPSTNIRLGSTYLQDLAQRYGDNRVLATAAYNAGPRRINEVLREQPAPMRADVWIERLPYRETRNYVQNVLAFAVIYSRRLGKPMPMLTKSEREITAQDWELSSAN